MRYTKVELEAMAAVYLKLSANIYGCTDGHFFYAEYEAQNHCDRNRVEYFEFKKTTKK